MEGQQVMKFTIARGVKENTEAIHFGEEVMKSAKISHGSDINYFWTSRHGAYRLYKDFVIVASTLDPAGYPWGTLHLRTARDAH